MRKYFHIYKSEVMSTMQYILNILLRLTSYSLHIFIFMCLWDYIYDNPNELINGYTKDQMIWYVIITEIIWVAADGRGLCRRISNDVKSGNIAYIMNKPYSYISYSLSSHLGSQTIKTMITLIVSLLIGAICLNGLPNLSILSIPIIVLSGILAILIGALLTISIGLISFVIEDSGPIYWLYSKMILVLGVIFPIEYFPGILGTIIRYSPIYVICYGPAKLFVDFNYSVAAEIIISQIIYLVFAWGLCKLLYMKGVKRLNVTGG